MSKGRHRILVIEGDPEIPEQIAEFLTTSGYHLDLAVDGDDGLSWACAADYAVATVDRMLPGLDGRTIGASRLVHDQSGRWQGSGTNDLRRGKQSEGVCCPIISASAQNTVGRSVCGRRA